ncbi:hypothetical protein [Amycolatopsis sp. GM8]|uniref:hypothetical protein n=1 Tax=Amycolatopsis sp. GM8 TaxID=2896530 RepID=UPI001F4759C0|nr:hypothetical protein [Amycolatopsis sp. GM8]
MTWQEDLRRLDVQLASGEISLREHRRQREELLAAASGGFSPSPVKAPVEGGQAHAWPESPAWPAEQPAAPSWSASLLSTDRPTSAPSPADENPTDSMRYPTTIHEAPTIVTRAIGPLPGLTPAKPEVPPLPTRPVRTGRGKPTWLFLALGIFIVLAMIIGATWLLGTRNDPSPASSAPTSSAPPVDPAGAAERAEARLPTLPGAANPANSTLSIDKALQLKLITQADADVMKAAGAQEIIYRAASNPANSPNGTALLVVPVPSPAEATKLAAAQRKHLTDTGFTMAALGPANADLIFTGSSSAGRVTALWYSSGPLAVGIGVSQPLTGDPNQLRSRLEQIRTQVTGAFPAG